MCKCIQVTVGRDTWVVGDTSIFPRLHTLIFFCYIFYNTLLFFKIPKEMFFFPSIYIETRCWEYIASTSTCDLYIVLRLCIYIYTFAPALRFLNIYISTHFFPQIYIYMHRKNNDYTFIYIYIYRGTTNPIIYISVNHFFLIKKIFDFFNTPNKTQNLLF